MNRRLQNTTDDSHAPTIADPIQRFGPFHHKFWPHETISAALHA